MMRGIRHSLLLLGIGMIASPAIAQQRGAPVRYPSTAVVQHNSGEQLRSHLRALAANPNSLEALIGAGRAALDSGDAEASLAFFGRADQVSPRNARAKAGMAAALAHLGQAQPSIALFGEAVSLGAPEYDIADDRGLAFDMAGDPRRAQQDYVLAMRYRDTPGLRRRMALSLAISGEREAALRLIDSQLRRNERAAWRTQAFVLALTGDYAGANLTARLMMPAGTAQAMAPFFARLPSLSPVQKARAVHLGQFPNGAQYSARPPASHPPADPAAVAMAMSGASSATRARSSVTSSTTATRPRGETGAATGSSRRRAPARDDVNTRVRRPDRTHDSSDPYNLRNDSAATRQPVRPAQLVSRQPAQTQPPPSEPPPTVVARWAGAPSIGQPASSQPLPVPPSASQPLQTASAANPPAQPSQANSLRSADPPSQPASTPTQSPIQIASTGLLESRLPAPDFADGPETAPQSRFSLDPSPASGRSSLADIAAVINALPPETSRSAEPSAAEAERAPVDPREAARPGATPPSHPSRHWVQIAGAANRGGLPGEFARLRALAPQQLGRRAAYTTPLRATNRLLVGPFDSVAAAQDFVNELARHDVAAFAWTSPVGQEIERLQTR